MLHLGGNKILVVAKTFKGAGELQRADKIR
jgi:hypothetical protein